MISFIGIRRKHVQLALGLGLLLILTISFSSTSYLLSEQSRLLTSKLSFNYFETLASNLYGTPTKSPVIWEDPNDADHGFTRKVAKLHQTKLKADLEHKFWLLDTDIANAPTIQVPHYYTSDQIKNPPIQPFDPRFTLGIYLHAIKKASQDKTRQPGADILLPFDWYDWVDLSALNRYLLAPVSEKPTCSLLDARKDEQEFERAEEAAKQKSEQEKQKAEKEKEDKEKSEKEGDKDAEKVELNPQEEQERKEKEQADQERAERERIIKETLERAKEKANESLDQQDNGNKKEKRSDVWDPVDFCSQTPVLQKTKNLSPGFHAYRSPSKSTPEKSILAGKSYLYSNAPPPSAIIFLTLDGAYNFSVSSMSKLLNNGLVEQYIKDTKSTKIDVLKEFTSLQSSVAANKLLVIDEYQIDIPKEDFLFNHTEIMTSLTKNNESNQITPREEKYLNSLAYSVHATDNGGPPKYFDEARLIGTALGDHYDWRFFNGLMYGVYEQTLVLHRLVRVWLSFTRKHGITTWVAHGSLLSWYWNGMAFPWDNDIDVQVPIMDLHKLSLLYNQSLIVEDASDGFGRYFLDCGTFITLREKGNGNNNIDARFIDVDTGLYIDITGLAVSDTDAPEKYAEKAPENKKKLLEQANEALRIEKEKEKKIQEEKDREKKEKEEKEKAQKEQEQKEKEQKEKEQKEKEQKEKEEKEKAQKEQDQSEQYQKEQVSNNKRDDQEKEVKESEVKEIQDNEQQDKEKEEKKKKEKEEEEKKAKEEKEKKEKEEKEQKEKEEKEKEEKIEIGHFQKNFILEAYNCRNQHFYTHSELSPLVKTSIEGEIGYIPKKYSDILTTEYTFGLLEKKFEGHIYIPSVRLWLREDDLFYFLKDPKKWNDFHRFNEKFMEGSNETSLFHLANYELTAAEKKQLHKEAKLRESEGKSGEDGSKTSLNDETTTRVFNLSQEEILQLLQKDEIFREYYSTHEFTAHHENELMRLLFGKSTSTMMSNAPDFKPMKYDPFLFRMHNDVLTYEGEVESYLALVEAYEVRSSHYNDPTY